MCKVRRKATENIHSGFALSDQVCDLHPVYFIIENAATRGATRKTFSVQITYQDSRVVWHIGLGLPVLLLLFGDLDVLHIASAEDNVVKFVTRAWNKVFGRSSFSAERIDIFQSYGRLLWIDLV